MTGLYGLYQLFDLIAGVITLAFWAVIILVAAFIIKRVFLPEKYGDDSIVERWDSVLTGQENLGARYLDTVEQLFKEKGIACQRARLAIPISSTSSDSHDFLVARLNDDYSCYYGFVSQGNDVHIAWLLQNHAIRGIYKLPFIGPMLLGLLKRYTFAMTSRVLAFTSSTHALAVQAVEKLMDELGMDKSKLDRKRSGKIGPI